MLPSIVVSAVDANGKDLTNVRVLVDGVIVSSKLDGRPIVVDPGEHSFTYETPGSPSVTETVLIRQAELARLLSVKLAPATPTTSERVRRIPLTSWVLGGVGIAAAGIGGALWVSGTSDHSSLEESCGATRSCAESDIDGGKTKLVVGDVAMGIGLVAIGAAVVLALVSKDDAATMSAMTRFRRFAP
jgi:hypothetical protein